MNEMIELEATFDTPNTARSVAKLLNFWFTWIMDGSSDDTSDLDDVFDEFGLSFNDYVLELDTDVDWNETPEAHAEGSTVVVTTDSRTGVDTIQALLADLGGDNVIARGEE